MSVLGGVVAWVGRDVGVREAEALSALDQARPLPDADSPRVVPR